MPKFRCYLLAGLLLMQLHGFVQWKTVSSGTKSYLRQICFPDTSNGYIIATPNAISARSMLLNTHDGGYTWMPMLYNNEMKAVDFLNKDTGAVLCVDTIYKTFDGGKNWVTIASKLKPGHLFHMNSATEWFFVNGQHWSYTKDAGLSWADSSDGNSGNLPIITLDMGFVNDTTVIGFGAYGPNMFRSDNKGITWIPANPNTYIPISTLSTGCTPDADNWYAAGTGINRSQTGGGICKSRDSGKTWLLIDSSTQSISCIRAYNSQNLYAVGSEGYITKTNDGGKTWMQDSSGSKLFLTNIVLLTGKIIAIGDSGLILINNNIQTGIFENNQSPLMANIYPNPGTGIFHVNLSSTLSGQAKVVVYDVYGRIVYAQEKISSSFDLNLNNLKDGIYFLSVFSNSKWEYIKLVIAK